MKKLLNKLLVPAVSSIFLLNLTSVGYAETTVSAEVGFVFNTFLNVFLPVGVFANFATSNTVPDASLNTFFKTLPGAV